MKKLGKVISLSVVVCLAVTVFGGCGSRKDEPVKNDASVQASAENTTKSEANPYEKHLEITIGYWEGNEAFGKGKEDKVLAKLENDFNVTFKSKSPTWQDADEKYKLWAASGELPDVFAHSIVNSDLYYSWIKQGVIHAIPDDLSKYPNIANIFTRADVKVLKAEDGKYYMIPRGSVLKPELNANASGFLVRKDWMEKLGIQTPRTYDEYIAMLKKFVESDPDGNGKKDTIGLTMRGTWFLNHLYMGLGNPNYANLTWMKEDGKWIPSFMSKTNADILKQLKKLYNDGLLDKDFAIEKLDEGSQKFLQGKAGLLATQTDIARIKQHSADWAKYNPDKDFFECVGFLPIWQNTDGKLYCYNGPTFWSQSYFNSSIDDEKMDRILRLYDYLESNDGLNLVLYGIEGVDYKKEGDKLVITRTKDTNGNYDDLTKTYPSLKIFKELTRWQNIQDQGINDLTVATFGEKQMKAYVDWMKWYTENATPINCSWEFEYMFTPNKSKVASVWPVDDMIKVILGKDDPAKMWQQITDGYSKNGVSDAIKEVNEKAAQSGLN